MKMILGLILFVFTSSVYAQALICNNGYGFDGAGTVMTGTDNKCYVKVKAGAAYADGDVVTLNYTNDNGYDVTTSTSAGYHAYCVFDAACASGAICKCQVFGKHDAVKTDVSNHNITAGLGLALSGTAKMAEGLPAGEGRGFATALDTASTSGTVEAFIHAL